MSENKKVSLADLMREQLAKEKARKWKWFK